MAGQGYMQRRNSLRDIWARLAAGTVPVGLAADAVAPGSLPRTLVGKIIEAGISPVDYVELGAAIAASVNRGTFSQSAGIVSHAFGYGSKCVVNIPEGDFALTTANIDIINAAREVEIRGAGRSASRILLPAGQYLLNTTLAQRSCHMSDFTVVGGKGLARFGYTGFNVQSHFLFERITLVDYTECGIGSLASDHPYLSVEHCIFFGCKEWTSIGLYLPSQTARSSINGNSFLRNKYHIKKSMNDSASNIGPNNEFLKFPGGYAGTRVADIWLVPRLTTQAGSGDGCGIRMNRFSGEQRTIGEYTILVADEDTSIGTDPMSYNAHKTSDASNAKHVTGLQVTDNCFSTINSPASANTSIIHSEIPKLSALTFRGNKCIGGWYPYVVNFASGVTPLEGTNARCSIIDLPPATTAAWQPFGCNFPGWATVYNPSGRAYPGPHMAVPAGQVSPRTVNLLNNSGNALSSWTSNGGATNTAYANDQYNNANSFRLITFSATTDSISSTIITANVRAGELAWLQFYVQAHDTNPLARCEVYIREKNGTVESYRGQVALSANVTFVQFPVIMNGGTGTADIRFTPFLFYGAAANTMRLSDVRLAHAPAPPHYSHAGTHGSGLWDGPHEIIGANHRWYDAGGLLRWQASAPTADTDGYPYGLKVAVPASATAPGAPGQWAADTSYHYDCVATDTWRRVAHATW